MQTENETKEHRFKFLSFPEFYDFNLVAAILLLVSFGLVMLYSTSSYIPDSNYFIKQAVISFGGLLIAMVISRLDYHCLFYISPVIYMVSVILMVLVQTPLGVEVNGARRWLRFGTSALQFQPSELAKIAVITLIPALILKFGKKLKEKRYQALLLLVGVFLAFCVYVFTENLSTALIVAGITVLLYFMAYPKTKKMLMTILLLGILAAAGLYFLNTALGDQIHKVDNYQIRRILTWINPEEGADKGSYQVMQGLYAIGSGGFLGKGLGNSVQKLGAVPEAHNDMIFAIICEELGIFGGILLLGLFAYLLYRLFWISVHAPDLYGSLLTAGIFFHVAMQVTLNISVVLNLIPTTGITLPFISYGGTSSVFLMMEMGMALSVSNQIRGKRKKVREKSVDK